MRVESFLEYSTGVDRAILLPNHLASSIDDATGDRAEYLNRVLKLPVIAYERPATATQPYLEVFNESRYRLDIVSRAKILHRILGGIGVKQLIVCGQSAGALDGLALAASGELAVEQVIAIDPTAMKITPKHVGGVVWGKEQLRGGKNEIAGPMFEGLAKMDNIREKASKLTLTKRAFKELKTYSDIFRTDLSMRFLDKLANDFPEVPVDLILAEHSFATSPLLLKEILLKFAGSSVKVEIIPEATHSFVDPHQNFIYIVQKALNLLPGNK